MADYAKVLPQPDADTRPFWEFCKAHELHVPRCLACGRFRWPPQAWCPSCHSWDFEWAGLSGRGTVQSFTVVHHAVVPAYQQDLPYVVGAIVLDGTDGRVCILSNVVDCAWEQVQVGMAVQVTFDDVTPEIALPKFRPA